MGIGDAIGIMSCLAGTMLAMPLLMIFLSMTFNRSTSAAAERLHNGFGVPVILGVLASAVIVVPASMLVGLGSIFQLIGILAYLAFLAWSFMGLGVVARLIGGRMFASSHIPPYAELIVGSFIMAFAIAFPLIGWLLIFPLASVAGIGSTLAVWRKSRKTSPAAYHTIEPAAELS